MKRFLLFLLSFMLVNTKFFGAADKSSPNEVLFINGNIYPNIHLAAKAARDDKNKGRIGSAKAVP